jgi:hypothetical protein
MRQMMAIYTPVYFVENSLKLGFLVRGRYNRQKTKDRCAIHDPHQFEILLVVKLQASSTFSWISL